MTPTPEQEAIFSAVGRGENCMVEALAGVGKTTTITEAIKYIPKEKSILLLAFGRDPKAELEKRTKGIERDITIVTMNGLGHRAIQRSLRKRPEVDNDKIYTLSKETGLKRQDLSDCMALARAARMAGVVPKGIAGRSLLPDNPDTWAEIAYDNDIDPIFAGPARDVLLASCRAALAGTIDYDDQIYISSLVLGLYDKFDVVLPDEAQDLSPFNHMQIAKAAKDQIVAVGDSHQAIYAWRGADSQSMEHLRALRPEWTDLTLSMTFRCPHSVVERQRKHVPLFTAAPTNALGAVNKLDRWRPEGGSHSAILCRNNAPLIRLAFRLLRQRIPVNYLGRDIGGNLKRLYNKLSDHGRRSLETTIANAQALAQSDPDKMDRCDSLIAILESFSDVDSAMKFLTEARTNSITLATGHKAKGLEWDRVYHLNPWLIPSKWVQEMEPDPYPDQDVPAQDPNYAAAQERYLAALAQENNLRYVIETRTKNELLLCNLEQLS